MPITNTPRPSSFYRDINTFKKLSLEQVAEMVEMFRKKDRTTREIARIYKIAPGSVYYHVRRAGLL